MQLMLITPQKLPLMRTKLIQFILDFGERRITKRSIQWLSQLTADNMLLDGTQILAAVDEHRLIGLSCVSCFGRNTALVVIHPNYRNKHLGSRLLAKHLQLLGSLAANVACDNTASIKMCKNAGLHPDFIFRGPTGKSTLRLVGGNRFFKESDFLCPSRA